MGHEWAAEWAAKLKRKQAEASLKDANFQERQRIKRDQGPGLWREVVQSLNNKCVLLNNAMSEEILGPDPEPITSTPYQVSLILRSHGSVSRLKVCFAQKADRVIAECTVGPTERKWELAVNQAGKAHFQEGMIPAAPEEIAERSLDMLLNGRTDTR